MPDDDSVEISRGRVNSREFTRIVCNALARSKDKIAASIWGRPEEPEAFETEEVFERPEIDYGYERGMTIEEIISKWKKRGPDAASP